MLARFILIVASLFSAVHVYRDEFESRPDDLHDISEVFIPSPEQIAATISQATVERNESLSSAEVYQRTLRGTVFVVNDLGGGKIAIGTGWLTDRNRRLVVTNDHVIDRTKRLMVFFPTYEQGQLIAERERYLTEQQPIHAALVDSEARCDLALLKLDRVPDDAVSLPLAQHSPMPGDTIHSIGNAAASSALWVYTVGAVRSVHRFREPSADGRKAFDARVVETQSPVNPGDSGGPVVNDRGELVAVVSRGRLDARLVVEFIDLEEVKAYLKVATPLVDPQTAQQFNSRGVRHFRQARYDFALSDFLEALRLKPNFKLAMSNRAWALYEKGDHVTALADFNALVEQDYRTDAVYHGRGLTYYKLRRMPEAIADLTEVVRQRPKDAMSYMERGHIYFAAEKYTSAADDFSRAIELAPSADAFYHRARALSESGHDADALADFDQAIERNPRKARFYNGRGYCHSRLRHFDAAFQDYSVAIKLNGTQALYFGNRGNLLSKSRQFKSALDDYTQAIALDPKNPRWYLKRASVLKQLGSKEAADADRRRAEELQVATKR